MAMIIQTVDGVVINKFDVGESPVKFGRSPDNQVQIDMLEVSNEHAQVVQETNEKGETACFFVDLGSTNGSFVNEVKIEKQQLHHNDKLRIGWNVFTFIDENEIDLKKTSEIKKSWIPGIYYSSD